MCTLCIQVCVLLSMSSGQVNPHVGNLMFLGCVLPVCIRSRLLLLLLHPVVCVQVSALSSVSVGEVNPHDGNLMFVVRIHHRLLLLLISPVVCVQVGALSSVLSGEVNPRDGNLTFVVRIRHRLLLLLSPVICVQVGSLSSVSSGEVNPHDGNLTLLSASAIAYYYYLALWYVYRWVRCHQCRQVRWTHMTATWRFLAMCSAAYLLTFVSASSCCSATCLESWRKRSSSVSTVTASSALHHYAVGC